MISIIGAGPTGCFSALSGIEKEDDIEIFESQKSLNERKVQCAGLVSKSGMQRLGISLSKDVILNTIQGAKFFSPSGREIRIDGKETKAYVLDRRKFDNFLLEKAIDSGVEFRNEKVKDLEKIKSRRVILATGTNYNLQRKLNLDMPNEFLLGAQYEMKIECEKKFVELHFNVPGFFSWVIPLGENHARVGLCSWKNPVFYLERFVKELKKEGRISQKEKILEKNFGLIPLYKPKIKTQYSKIVTVGDAASHVKATSGGGIVMGCLAAKFSCEENYGKKWKKEIGRELHLHLIIRKFLNKLSEKNLERAFSLMEESKEVIEEKGDMDFASKIIFNLGRNPGFMLRFFSNIPYFLRDLL